MMDYVLVLVPLYTAVALLYESAASSPTAAGFKAAAANAGAVALKRGPTSR